MVLEIIEFIKDSIFYIIVAATVIFFMMYVASFVTVSGDSMYPTLEDNQMLVLNKFKYSFSEPERFDIVAVEFGVPNYLIKRIVGLPGEIVEYKDNTLYVNGETIEEDFIFGEITNDFSLEEIGEIVIPEDMYFVVGDNRDFSTDSRDSQIGLISKDDILGTTNIVVWPIKSWGIVE